MDFRRMMELHDLYNKHEIDEDGVCKTCFKICYVKGLTLKKYLEKIPLEIYDEIVSYIIEKNPDLKEKIKRTSEEIKEKRR